MQRRILTSVAVFGVAGAMLLGACGSDSDSSGANDPPSTLTGTAPSTTTTEAPTTTTTTAPAGPKVAGAVIFEDPQGDYSIEISPDWTDVTGTPTAPAEVEAWQIGIADGEFQDNVNLLTQSTGGADLDAYLERSADNLGGLTLIEQKVVTGANGNELGVFEYNGDVPGAPIPLHALATVTVSGGQAVIATLTTGEATFAQARAAVEPYLLTLQDK